MSTSSLNYTFPVTHVYGNIDNATISIPLSMTGNRRRVKFPIRVQVQLHLPSDQRNNPSTNRKRRAHFRLPNDFRRHAPNVNQSDICLRISATEFVQEMTQRGDRMFTVQISRRIKTPNPVRFQMVFGVPIVHIENTSMRHCGTTFWNLNDKDLPEPENRRR